VKVEHRELVERVRTGRRVLVVDDHPSFRASARALLTEEGFDVVGEAADGAEAVAAVAELTPDLVLLDIQLPDMDGFDVARRLLERSPELRVILISSRDHSQYGPLIEESGALGFVTKSDLTGATLERLLA
jgi:DNA-binding NarL/FixJ family response regulator